MVSWLVLVCEEIKCSPFRRKQPGEKVCSFVVISDMDKCLIAKDVVVMDRLGPDSEAGSVLGSICPIRLCSIRRSLNFVRIPRLLK